MPLTRGEAVGYDAVALPPDFTISLTLRRNLGLRGRAFIVRLQAIQ